MHVWVEYTSVPLNSSYCANSVCVCVCVGGGGGGGRDLLYFIVSELSVYQPPLSTFVLPGFQSKKGHHPLHYRVALLAVITVLGEHKEC